MTNIIFYDVSEIDQIQIPANLSGIDANVQYVTGAISDDNLNPDADVISVFVSSTVTREMIEKMPNLRLISCRSTGFNNIDLDAAQEHDVTVTNVPSYGENTVAEYAFTLILALARKLSATLREVNSAQIDHSQLHGTDIAGKTLGVVGMGRIGQHAARIGKGFGLEVLAFDPFPNEEKAKEIGYQYVTLDDIAARSDFISVHAPYTKENHHIIGADFFGKVKPSAILVNTARGELVDTEALIRALHDNHIAGAGLDVLEGEDMLDIEHEFPALCQGDNPNKLKECVQIDMLEKMPNVILTPHNAYNTSEAIARINKTSIDNITSFLNNSPVNIVH